VLDACLKHKVKWLVITSSIVAVFDPAKDKEVFDESDFLEINKNTPPYDKSKLLAEKTAWDFQAKLPKES